MSTKKIQILNGASIIPKPDQTYSPDSENAQSGKAVAEAISKISGGKGIDSIEKTSTSGLIDTYTITYTDDTTSTFELTNGKGITDISIGYISGDSGDLGFDSVRKGLIFRYSDGTETKISLPEIFEKDISIREINNGISIDYIDGESMGTYTITNGKDGVSVNSITQTTTSIEDDGNNIITVTLSDGQTSTFTVKNGSKGDPFTYQDFTTEQLELLKGDDYVLTEADKLEIAELVDNATIVQAPKFVDSVDKMIDINRPYVLSSTGEIWSYMNTTTEQEITDTVEGTTENPYLDGNRLASDGSAVNDSAEMVVTPYIDLGKYEQYRIIKLKLAGIQYIFSSHTANVRVGLYDEDKNKIMCVESCLDSSYGIGGTIGFTITSDNSATATLTLPYIYSDATVKYMRFSTIGSSANSDISITYTGQVTGGQWVNTGVTYTPTVTSEIKSEIVNEVANLVDSELLNIIGTGEVTV